MTVLERYIILLNCKDQVLLMMVDLYNAGKLSPKTKLALEMIDGCAGPGDRIVGSTFKIGEAA